MSFTVDTNVLAYAVDPGDRRGAVARRIMSSTPFTDCVLTNQVLGEFLNVVRTKNIMALDLARSAVLDWSLLLPVLPTETEHLLSASLLSERHDLQLWDSVILTVAASSGVTVLATEDMQDGALIDGVRLLNPFDPANGELLDLLLTPAP